MLKIAGYDHRFDIFALTKSLDRLTRMKTNYYDWSEKVF